MTDEDIEIIRNAVRDVIAPMERRIIAACRLSKTGSKS
jgi:hypothetical protein